MSKPKEEKAVPETASMANDWAVGALKPKSIDNKPMEFLSQLAKDIATNLVFTDAHIRDFDIQHMKIIFMPLALGALADTTEEYRKDIGMIYEYYDKSAPRAMNGYPMFFSFAYINKHDATIVWDKVNKIKAVMEGI